ncbi:MAG: hypothetical protein ACRDT2_13220 [Natronosporangium sp.]
MVTNTLARLQVVWQQALVRLRDDRGSYSTETAVVTTLLVGGAILILGIIVAFGTDLANNIQFGPGPAQP